MATRLEPRTSLDLRGRTITTYIVHEIRRALTTMACGERIEVVTDPFEAITIDLQTWCRVTGNQLVEADDAGPSWRFTIEKGAPSPTIRSYAGIVQDDGLMELLSPLGFALAAALEGYQVSLFFQGPAVKVLRKGYVARLHGIGRPFSRFPRLGLERAGHLPPQEKLRQLRGLGAHIYACGPSMHHFGVTEHELAVDDVTVCEYLTFLEQIEQADVRLF